MESIHIQSDENRIKTINRFCQSIAISSLPSCILYFVQGIYPLALATGLIALIFLGFIYLNKHKKYNISRIGIVLTTIIGILFFSYYLGFNTGFYFYFFAAPLLIYLLYDFTEQKKIYALLSIYICTFVVIFLFKDVSYVIPGTLSPSLIKLIYTFNFFSSFIICFVLIIHFANNNHKYITNLINHQDSLQQEMQMRNQSEEMLRKSLKERELLLSEIHHRVKNNLAIISALINLKIDDLEEESSKVIFEETKNRIYAMSLIHNLLYQNNSFSKIDFASYINSFCTNISNSFENRTQVNILQEIETIEMDINLAIPLAMIMNELITNSYKHAFTNEKKGIIKIGLSKVSPTQMNFWVYDSGSGMDVSKLESKNMGMNIIHSLIEQIDAKLSYKNNNGSQFTISIPLKAN